MMSIQDEMLVIEEEIRQAANELAIRWSIEERTSIRMAQRCLLLVLQDPIASSMILDLMTGCRPQLERIKPNGLNTP